MTYVNKAGWLYKRGRLQRRWVRRWFSVNSHRCSFKYCNSPGPVSSASLASTFNLQHFVISSGRVCSIESYVCDLCHTVKRGRKGRTEHIGYSQPGKVH